MTLKPCPCGETVNGFVAGCLEGAPYGYLKAKGHACQFWVPLSLEHFDEVYLTEAKIEELWNSAAWNSAPRAEEYS